MMKKIITASLLAMALTSCYKDNFRERHPIVAASNCDTTSAMSFSTHIKPILDNNCTANCHNGNNSGQLIITWSDIQTNYSFSKLLSSVTWDGNTQTMPQNATSKLPICDITKIKKWVNAGALNN